MGPLISLAGFPVVDYVETGVREVFTKAPYLAGMAVGALVGSSEVVAEIKSG